MLIQDNPQLCLRSSLLLLLLLSLLPRLTRTGSPWRWRSGCWMTRARWNIWLVSNYRKCVNMSNVKCVKSEALAIMIKGWSYLSKGAILVASSTCGKNTNIKRNAKAKASVTFLKINHAKIQHKQVSSCDSARPTKTIIIINFVRLCHLFHWSWSSKPPSMPISPD